MEKGVSPVISVVLLIGLAITIGIMVTTWVTQLVTRETDPSSVCALNTNYIINDATYNFSGDYVLRIRITNKGTEGIYGFGVIINNDTSIFQFNKSHVNFSVSPSTITKDRRLGQEQSAYINVVMNFTGTADCPACDSLAKTATRLRVTNEACIAISAETSTITKYPL